MKTILVCSFITDQILLLLWWWLLLIFLKLIFNIFWNLCNWLRLFTSLTKILVVFLFFLLERIILIHQFLHNWRICSSKNLLNLLLLLKVVLKQQQFLKIILCSFLIIWWLGVLLLSSSSLSCFSLINRMLSSIYCSRKIVMTCSQFTTKITFNRVVCQQRWF